MRHFIHFTDSTLFEVIHSFLINDLIVTIPTARGSQRAIEMSCSDLLLANPLRKHNVSKEILQGNIVECYSDLNMGPMRIDGEGPQKNILKVGDSRSQAFGS